MNSRHALNELTRTVLEDLAAEVMQRVPPSVVWHFEIVPSEMDELLALLTFASKTDPTEELVVASVTIRRRPRPEAVFDISDRTHFIGETTVPLAPAFTIAAANDAIGGSAEFFHRLIPDVAIALSEA